MIKVKATLHNRIDAISDALNTRGKRKATKKVADMVAEEARSLAPVDTGRLRGSIDVVRDGNNHVVVTDAPYAGFVEFGTSRQPAQPFLGPAAETVKLALLDLEDVLR